MVVHVRRDGLRIGEGGYGDVWDKDARDGVVWEDSSGAALMSVRTVPRDDDRVVERCGGVFLLLFRATTGAKRS